MIDLPPCPFCGGEARLTMRDFEQDRRTLQDRKDGYVMDQVFLKYAVNGWPAALEEIKRLDERVKELESMLKEGKDENDVN